MPGTPARSLYHDPTIAGSMAYATAAVRAAPVIGQGSKRGRMAPARVQTGPMQLRPAPDSVLHRLVNSRTQATYGLRLSVRATKNFSGEDYSKLTLEIKQAVAQQINEVAAAANLATKITPSALALKLVYSQYVESNPQAVTYCIGVPGDELLQNVVQRHMEQFGGLAIDLGREQPALAMPFTGSDALSTGWYFVEVTADVFQDISADTVAALLQWQGPAPMWVAPTGESTQPWVREGGAQPDISKLLSLLPGRGGSEQRFLALVSGGHAFIQNAMKAGRVEVQRDNGESIPLRLWRLTPTVRKKKAALDATGQAMVDAAKAAVKAFTPEPNPTDPTEAPTLGKEQQPPAPGNEQQAPAPGDEQQPPAPGIEQLPPAPGNEQQPPSPGNVQKPPAPGNEKPPAPDNEQQPPAPDNEQQPPAPGNEQQPPAPGNEQQPPAPGDTLPHQQVAVAADATTAVAATTHSSATTTSAAATGNTSASNANAAPTMALRAAGAIACYAVAVTADPPPNRDPPNTPVTNGESQWMAVGKNGKAAGGGKRGAGKAGLKSPGLQPRKILLTNESEARDDKMG